MTISNEPLDELLKRCKRPEDLLGDAGLMRQPASFGGRWTGRRSRSPPSRSALKRLPGSGAECDQWKSRLGNRRLACSRGCRARGTGIGRGALSVLEVVWLIASGRGWPRSDSRCETSSIVSAIR